MQISDVFTIEKFQDKCFGRTELTKEVFNKMLVIEKGRGVLELANVPHTISKGMVYLIGKDKQVFFRENKISGYLLQFDESFWQKTPLSANNCKEVLFNRSIDSFTLIPDKQHFDHLLALLELT